MEKKKILVVDDEPNIRQLIKRAFGEEYEIAEAADGQQAIDHVRSEKPDLVLMDIMMPNVDGYTACSVITSLPATKGIPVVMLTAVGSVLNKELAQKIGAAAYITKPFSPKALLDVVGPLLGAK